MKHSPLIALVLGIIPLLDATLLQAQNYATPYTFTTLAGHAGFGGNHDGTGTNALFYFPHDVAVDGSGNVYVADTDNCTIRKINSKGVVTTIAGHEAPGHVFIGGTNNGTGTNDGTGANASFNAPGGIAIDTQGNLFISDSGNFTIRKITPMGVVSTVAGAARLAGTNDGTGTNARFNNPGGIAVDTQGNLYVADTLNNTIRKIDTNHVVTTLAGQAGVMFNSDHAPGTDWIDGTGTNATFLLPDGIAVDKQGNLYVADGTETIRKIDTNEVVTTLAGQTAAFRANTNDDGTGTNAAFEYPRGIAIDKQGNLYVTDGTTIRKIDTNEVVTTLAGKIVTQGSSDGTGTNATFSGPEGIAVDMQGTLYVADASRSTIREGSYGANPQTITFNAIPTKVFGTPSFSLTATASSALPVTFTSSSTNVASVSSNTVMILGAGTTTITADQAGDATWKPAAPKSQILTVGQAPQTLTFDPIPAQTFGDPTLSLTATALLPSTVTFTSSKTNVATISGESVTIAGAGLTTITATAVSTDYKTATAHQVLMVSKAPQTISFATPSTESFVQGGTGTFTLSAIAPGGTVSFKSSKPTVISIMGSTATIKAIGSATITATQTGNANYNAATPVALPVTVTPQTP